MGGGNAAKRGRTFATILAAIVEALSAIASSGIRPLACMVADSTMVATVKMRVSTFALSSSLTETRLHLGGRRRKNRPRRRLVGSEAIDPEVQADRCVEKLLRALPAWMMRVALGTCLDRAVLGQLWNRSPPDGMLVGAGGMTNSRALRRAADSTNASASAALAPIEMRWSRSGGGNGRGFGLEGSP